MGNDRTAIDTITGYYYQFDYYILKLLEQQNGSDSVCIEGIEDVDIKSVDETIAVQCKYYSKTEYNHSVIAKPIRLMLSHYAASSSTGRTLQYKIYGYYSSGQEKLPSNIDVSFAKSKFFTYTERKTKHEHHVELGLTDIEISEFLSHLSIDVYALNFDEQETKIINLIKVLFSCNAFEAEHYYYNNALRVIKELSIKQDVTERTITKSEFIAKINNKNTLFNLWFLKKKGIKSYCQSVKVQYFSPRNVSPFERFFLIECDNTSTEAELKSLLLNISKNWSKLSQRESRPFCPYVYLQNVSEPTLLNLKRALQSDDFNFWDGYDFKDADFSANSICRKATAHNNVKLKIINDIDQLDDILNSISTTRELYQFYITEPYYTNDIHKHIKIQVEETMNISSII